MKKIYCMIDSGSGLNIANAAMGKKFKEFKKTRKRSFTVSVANNEEVILREYLELEINDPLNLNEHYRKIITRFYIIEQSPYEFIIGRSLMYKLGFMLVRDRDILSYIHRAKNISDIIDIKSHYYQSIDYHIGHPMEIQETVNAIKSGELKMDVDEFDDKNARILFEKTMMQFADVFSRNGEIGAHPTTMTIDLKENAVGFHDNLYPMSFKKEQTMIKEINKLLENKIIEKCAINEDLLYVSTAFLVSGGHKAYDMAGNSIKGSDRLVVNYIWLNLWTKRHPYLIPMVDDILKQLHGKKKFFLLDIKKGFYHMVLTEQAAKLTAFRTPIGIFKWKRCPFGVINGPSNFQQRMDEGLADVCAVFIDDILGGVKEGKHPRNQSTTVEMLLVEKLIIVLKRLKKMNVKLGMAKCTFNKRKIEFLGRIITEEGLTLAPKHKSNIMNARVPKNKNELASFMGLINILGSQIPHLADYVQEFTDIRRHIAAYVWTERHQSVFEALKRLMNKLPILHHPDLTEEGGRFWVFNDSSGSAIGGVLMQERDSQLVPISFHSRILRDNERNWHISEQEMQAMIENSNEWRKLLQPRLFIHVTDHENLLNLLNFASKLKSKNTRLQRQISQIADYEFICLFRPGKSMTIADYLSRCIDHDAQNGMVDELQVRRELNLKSRASKTVIKEFEDKFNKSTFNNFVKRIPMSFNKEGRWKEVKNYEEYIDYETNETHKTINTIKMKDLIKNNMNLKMMSNDNKNIRRKLTYEQKRRIAFEKLDGKRNKRMKRILAVKTLPNMPVYDDVQRYISKDKILNEILNMKNMNVELILNHQKNDIIINPLMRFAQSSNAHWLELIPKKIRAEAIQGKYIIRNDGLLITNEKQICIPRTLQASFVHHFHSSSFMQHQSLHRMILMMKERVFWPEMSSTIEEYIKYCHYCQIIKKNKSKNNYISKDFTPKMVNELISMDTVGPLPADAAGNMYYSTIKDLFDKYIVIEAHKTVQSECLSRVLLDRWIYVFGTPKKLLLDNGSGYNSCMMKCLYKCFNIKDIQISAGNAKCNGANEVSHNYITPRIAINNTIRKDTFNTLFHENWSDLLKAIQFSYNCTPNRMTGVSPFEMRFGVRACLPIDRILHMNEMDNNKFSYESDGESNKIRDKKYASYIVRLQEQMRIINQSTEEKLAKYIAEKERQLNKAAKDVPLEIGEEVMLWVKHKKWNDRKLSPKWKPGFIIVQRMKNGITYKVIEQKTGMQKNEHRENIRPYNKWVLYKQQKLLQENETVQMDKYFFDK